jgi:hypothetical protein
MFTSRRCSNRGGVRRAHPPADRSDETGQDACDLRTSGESDPARVVSRDYLLVGRNGSGHNTGHAFTFANHHFGRAATWTATN